MLFCRKNFFFCLLVSVLLASSPHCQARFRHYNFFVKEALYKRVCHSKEILTVNGQFPGPTLYASKGETVIVQVYNRGKENITIHWHGVKQPRNPWSDGPEYVTQCPIQPGNKFRQTVMFSDEEGTLWWHAHSDWSRATVHGAIIVYPKPGTSYPFPQPYGEVPIIFGEWWREDLKLVLKDLLATGGPPLDSAAYTINGQPGDLYPCSKIGTFQLHVVYGKTYLLRIINAVLNEILFFAIANHTLTVVGTDGSYAKPLTRNFIVIGPGQTLDCLLHVNQRPDHYYMAARAYVSGVNVSFDNNTSTALLKYHGTYSPSSLLPLPYLPYFNETSAVLNFSGSLRSLASKEHPVNVPLKVKTKLVSTISVNALPCPNNTCHGPNGTRLVASMNNITYASPQIDILEAYYYRIKGVYGKNFPKQPPFGFNYTADILPLELLISQRGTRVNVLKYNATVEMVLQGTNLVAGIDHPMHIHGLDFYIVGSGLGNFDKNRDPLNYNLVDPPRRNTVVVPKNGWTTIRFQANNPGVWFMHCHYERHQTWGMDTVFIVKDGKNPGEKLLPPPPDMPPCG